MTLIKWQKPSNGLERRNIFSPSLHSMFDDFFNDSFLSQEFAGFVPAVNVSENEKSVKIDVSAPGFSKEDFNVSFSNGELTVSGEHKSESNSKETNYSRKEFSFGSFKRTFYFDVPVDEENIMAKYENGILKIELPKTEKSKTGKQISVS